MTGVGEILAGDRDLGGLLRLQSREASPPQQLGRAKDRDLAGSTGRAGRSSAGKRLTGIFIGGFLIVNNSHHNSHRRSGEASVADRPPKSR
jgi:hypothetical protein